MKFEVDIGEVRDEERAKECIKGLFEVYFLPHFGGFTLYFPSVRKNVLNKKGK